MHSVFMVLYNSQTQHQIGPECLLFKYLLNRAVSKGGVGVRHPQSSETLGKTCHFSPRKFSGGQPLGKICKEKTKGALSANWDSHTPPSRKVLATPLLLNCQKKCWITNGPLIYDTFVDFCWQTYSFLPSSKRWRNEKFNLIFWYRHRYIRVDRIDTRLCKKRIGQRGIKGAQNVGGHQFQVSTK